MLGSDRRHWRLDGWSRSVGRATRVLGVLTRIAPACCVLALAAQAQDARDLGPGVAGARAGRITVTIMVRDPDGVPLAGATLSVPGSHWRATTGLAGGVQVTARSGGLLDARVHRVGYVPAAVRLPITDDGAHELTVTLSPVVRRDDEIVVRSSEARDATADAAARRAERRLDGSGYVFTRDDIEQRNPERLSDLLRSAPGIQIGGSPWSGGSVRLRGADRRCWPLVVLDGSPLAAAEFDVDAIDPRGLAAVEVYPGPASVPSELAVPRGRSRCGVIALWTRRPGPQRAAARHESALATVRSPEELASLLETHGAYIDAQVDTIARADARSIRPTYPPALLAARAGGVAIAEFVVDATGRVLPDTFGVVGTTHPALAAAVRAALVGARFRPAVMGGVTVPQLVRQTLRFEYDGGQ